MGSRDKSRVKACASLRRIGERYEFSAQQWDDSGRSDTWTMEINALRRAPELPDAYFAVYEALEAQVRAYPLLARPRNRARLHVLLAFEMQAQLMRAIGEREIHARRQLGLPVSTNQFALAMHGCHRGLTILLRTIDNAAVPDQLPAEPDGAIQDEARTALKAINGLIEQFTALDDVAIAGAAAQLRARF